MGELILAQQEAFKQALVNSAEQADKLARMLMNNGEEENGLSFLLMASKFREIIKVLENK